MLQFDSKHVESQCCSDIREVVKPRWQKPCCTNLESFPYQTGTIYSFCISAKLNMGAGRIMGFIDNVCPSAYEMSPQRTIDNFEIPSTDKVKTAILFIKHV